MVIPCKDNRSKRNYLSIGENAVRVKPSKAKLQAAQKLFRQSKYDKLAFWGLANLVQILRAVTRNGSTLSQGYIITCW